MNDPLADTIADFNSIDYDALKARSESCYALAINRDHDHPATVEACRVNNFCDALEDCLDVVWLMSQCPACNAEETQGLIDADNHYGQYTHRPRERACSRVDSHGVTSSRARTADTPDSSSHDKPLALAPLCA
jgi:hypothetical protein